MLSRQIAEKLRAYETPFYLYDMALLRQTLESVVYESNKYGYRLHYAIKANYDDHLLETIRAYGLGIDCASGNELRKAIEAGFDPRTIVYAGVGKRDKELRYAIEQRILAINCESIEELHLVDRLSAEAGCTTDVALRINPDIDPKTNHCIDTGQADSKFGISYEEKETPDGKEYSLYLNGEFVNFFSDLKPDGSVFSFGSTRQTAGGLEVYTVYENGKLVGITQS